MAILYKREDLRSEERIATNLPVEITAYDSKGLYCTQQSIIEDVTSVGCRFRWNSELQRGNIVAINSLGPGMKSVTSGKGLLFEIMWCARDGGHWSTGARRLEGERLAQARSLLENTRSMRVSK